MEITLGIMAAGIGSRFKDGCKQLTPVGPSDEVIMEYSISMRWKQVLTILYLLSERIWKRISEHSLVQSWKDCVK